MDYLGAVLFNDHEISLHQMIIENVKWNGGRLINFRGKITMMKIVTSQCLEVTPSTSVTSETLLTPHQDLY